MDYTNDPTLKSNSIVKCEDCGSVVTLKNMKQHMTTKKHMRAIGKGDENPTKRAIPKADKAREDAYKAEKLKSQPKVDDEEDEGDEEGEGDDIIAILDGLELINSSIESLRAEMTEFKQDTKNNLGVLSQQIDEIADMIEEEECESVKEDEKVVESSSSSSSSEDEEPPKKVVKKPVIKKVSIKESTEEITTDKDTKKDGE